MATIGIHSYQWRWWWLFHLMPRFRRKVRRIIPRQHFCFPFLKWAARTHEFHSLGGNNPQWLSELRRLWTRFPRRAVCRAHFSESFLYYAWTASQPATTSCQSGLCTLHTNKIMIAIRWAHLPRLFLNLLQSAAGLEVLIFQCKLLFYLVFTLRYCAGEKDKPSVAYSLQWYSWYPFFFGSILFFHSFIYLFEYGRTDLLGYKGYKWEDKYVIEF